VSEFEGAAMPHGETIETAITYLTPREWVASRNL